MPIGDGRILRTGQDRYARRIAYWQQRLCIKIDSPRLRGSIRAYEMMPILFILAYRHAIVQRNTEYRASAEQRRQHTRFNVLLCPGRCIGEDGRTAISSK
jgi:hypothetical protein